MVGLNSILLPIFSSISDRREQVELLENRGLNYLRIINQENTLRDKLEKAQNLPLPDLFYHGVTDVDLNAQMQADVRRLIDQAGGRINNMQSIAIVESDNMYRVGFRMESQMDMAALTRILEQFRRHNKLLNLDNLSLRTQEQQNPNSSPIIAVRWEIFGYGLLDREGAVDG